MRRYLLGFVLLFLSVAVAGCSSSEAEQQPTVYQPPPSLMADKIDISLADLLARPRSELATQAREWEAKITAQEKGIKEGRLNLILLPTFRLPRVVPVLREASYSEQAGFSLPPYATAGAKDSAMAVHLARYGDAEAANQLVQPGDNEAAQQIQAARCERNYPLEWTRLVGLMLHAAHLRLAAGDVDGGTEIVVLHRQLRSLLDSRAAQGPLGAALLGRGRNILARAAVAWRESNKKEVATQADAALADWGEVPAPALAIGFGMPRDWLSQALGNAGGGRLIQAITAGRGLDILDLPFPEQGAEGVVAWFDQADRLTDVWVIYRSGFGESFPEPGELAYALQESRLEASDLPRLAGLRPRSYSSDQAAYDVTVVANGAGLGAWVRVHGNGAPAAESKLARDFGGFHLDRSFEQNRLRLARDQRGETVIARHPQALADIRNPIPLLKPAQATLQREKDQDLTAGFSISYQADEHGPPGLLQWLVPLGAEAGRPEFQDVEAAQDRYLAVIWSDGRTRYRVHLPYEAGHAVVFEANDIQDKEHAERQAAAVALDRTERQARLAAGNPLLLLPRKLESFELGMSHAQVAQLLPRLQSVLRRDIPGGFTVTFAGEPASGDPYLARQLFVRFNEADQAVDVRIRYADGAATQERGNWTNTLLADLQKSAGAPWKELGPWAAVWSDSANEGPAPLYCVWRDDRSLATYQRDGAGVEIAIRDCPEQQEAGVPLPPLEYLPRGVDNAELGIKRAELLEKLGGTRPAATDDGAWVLPAPQGGPYDAVLVWFEKDQVTRIVARQADKTGEKRDAAGAAQALMEAWARDIVRLGWPRRQDQGRTEQLQTLGWNDDRTRVRIFWQEDDSGGIRIYMEWKDLAR
jgi:hypothetical protein